RPVRHLLPVHHRVRSLPPRPDMNEERRNEGAERRRTDRRKADRRRGGPPVMQDRRTRFSLLYFAIVVAIVLGLNYIMGRGTTERAQYGELKQRIAAGQIDRVVIGPQQMRLTPNDSLRGAGAPD